VILYFEPIRVPKGSRRAINHFEYAREKITHAV
jgi:hypothetical protein